MLMIRQCAVCARVTMSMSMCAHLDTALINVIRRNLMIEQYQSVVCVYDVFIH